MPSHIPLIVIYCDSKLSISLFNYKSLNTKMNKHIQIQHMSLCRYLKHNIVNIEYAKLNLNLAKCLIKRAQTSREIEINL